MESLRFAKKVQYAVSQLGIPVPVVLANGALQIKLEAKIDTGADFCFFDSSYAELLGLELQQGIPKTIATPTGHSFQAYGHTLSLTTFGFTFDEAIVYFAEGLRRNVLGRRGWLDQLRLGLVDYDRTLYLSRYDD